MCAGPDEPGQHFVPLPNLLFDRPCRIGKSRSDAAQRFLGAVQSRPLSWKGHFLNHVGLEVLAGCFDVSSSENAGKEFTDASLVSVRHVHLSQASSGGP